MKLDVMICTIGRRLGQIDLEGLPQVEGVRYLICCQNPDGLDLANESRSLESRSDIELHMFDDRGLSYNRNHALELVDADYVLVSDDDLYYSAAGLNAIIKIFDSEPDLDILTFKAIIPEKHIYPPDGHRLGDKFKNYSPMAIEIAVRLKSLNAKKIHFSPLAGIGAPYLTAGEDDLFMHTMLKSGMKGRFADISPVSHRGVTTCTHSAGKPGILRAKGALMWLIRTPVGALIRYPLEAYRAPIAFHKALLYLVQGMAYAIKHRKEL